MGEQDAGAGAACGFSAAVRFCVCKPRCRAGECCEPEPVGRFLIFLPFLALLIRQVCVGVCQTCNDEGPAFHGDGNRFVIQDDCAVGGNGRKKGLFIRIELMVAGDVIDGAETADAFHKALDVGKGFLLPHVLVKDVSGHDNQIGPGFPDAADEDAVLSPVVVAVQVGKLQDPDFRSASGIGT